jgi:mycothiol synthase
MDLRVRPYAVEDAEAVAELLNSVERHTGGEPRFTAQDLRESWPSWVDPEQDTRLVIGPDGAPIAYGVAQAPPPDGRRAGAYGVVAPQWRGRGLGRDLLAWQLERVDLIYRSSAADASWTVDSVANATDATAIRLFERFGMELRHELLQMEAPTALATVPMTGPRVATGEHVDPRALYDVHMAVFGENPGYQRRPFDAWLRTSLESAGFRPDLSRVAYDDAGIVSYALGYDDNAPEKLYIGQVGTRRDARGRGYAAGVLSEVLAAGAASGKRAARLNVDADNSAAIGVYERAGFVVRNRILAYARPVGRA